MIANNLNKLLLNSVSSPRLAICEGRDERLSMARYFFDLYECGTVSRDDEGSVMANRDEVRNEALRAAREVMCAEIKEGRLCLSCRIDVRDETGATALSLPFKEALAITGL